MNAIDLKNVSKKYRIGESELFALRDVSAAVKEGEFVAVVGSSGSGKSTLLHIMGALDRPTNGMVKISGRSVESMSDDELAELRSREIGFVFQTFNLVPRLTAIENVLMPMYFNGSSDREKAVKLLADVGLEKRAGHMPGQLSGGERQRVAIARALINNPKIILADEPTGNLDSTTGKKIIEIFSKLNREGRTVVIITHDMGIARNAKRRIKIKDGMIQK